MDENLAWKIVYAAAIFSLIVLGIAYSLISSREPTSLKEASSPRLAEFKNTRIEGRKEGKKIWEFNAESGWTEKDQAMTHLTNVSGGRIFAGRRLVMDDLAAPKVDVTRNADIVEAFSQPELGGRKSLLSANLDLGELCVTSKECQWTRMFADEIKYVPADKRSEIKGHVFLKTRDAVIHADDIIVDHDKKSARLTGAVSVKRANGLIRTAAFDYLAEPEQATVPGPLTLALKEKKILTDLKCNSGVFFMDINKDISLSGSLEVSQGKKIAIADEGVYSRQRNGLLLKGRTRTVMQKGGALLKQETVSKMRDPNLKDLLHDLTIVKANEIFFSTRTGDAQATGSVEVSQKGREARSEQAVYDDKNELLTLTGNVFMKKGEDWISCRSVVVSVRKETFEAHGVREAKFEL